MDEVVEITVGAMHLMAKDMSSRLKMKQLNCIPFFVQVGVHDCDSASSVLWSICFV